jgi:hypothetical protein
MPELKRYRAGSVVATQGPVLKLVDSAELRVVVAAVLAVATDGVLVAHHIPNTWCPSGYRTGPPKFAQSRAKKKPGSGEHARELKLIERGNIRNSVW